MKKIGFIFVFAGFVSIGSYGQKNTQEKVKMEKVIVIEDFIEPVVNLKKSEELTTGAKKDLEEREKVIYENVQTESDFDTKEKRLIEIYTETENSLKMIEEENLKSLRILNDTIAE